MQEFAEVMLRVLRRPKNIRKAHWADRSDHYLLARLEEEVDELDEALASGKGDVESEAADVANIAFMLWDNHMNRAQKRSA